jgi:tetratricopeptide (TPR) repeat protein
MNDYKYYLDNGIFDFQSGKYNDAIENFNKSLELKNDWEIPYFYRAAANHALENFDEAILDYTKSIQLNEKMTDAYYNRAKILLSRKDIENPDLNRAISDLEKALELDPSFVDALYAMGAAQKKVENYHKALEFLNRAIELQPDFVHAKALQKLILTKYLKNL